MSADPQSRWYELVRRLGRGPNLRPLEPEEAWAEYREAPDRPAPAPRLAGFGDDIEIDIEIDAVDDTEQLLERARANDSSAWHELVRRYRTRLMAQIQARTSGSARRWLDPDDLLQGVFARAWEGLASFEYRGEASFRRWLSSLVTRELRAFQTPPRRSRPTPPRPDELELLDTASGEPPQPGEARHMLANMGKLGLEDRHILAMRHFEDMSFEAIAAALGVSLETARQLYQRALERLQRLLKDPRE